ncbi:unnamed protein product, partial [Staurois parvus]
TQTTGGEISPLWEGQRHKLLERNLPIVGGAETQTTGEKSPHCGRGRDTNYWEEISPLWEGQRHTTGEKSPHCRRGRDTNYWEEISPLWEGQRHKLLGGNIPIVGGAETQTTGG